MSSSLDSVSSGWIPGRFRLTISSFADNEENQLAQGINCRFGSSYWTQLNHSLLRRDPPFFFFLSFDTDQWANIHLHCLIEPLRNLPSLKVICPRPASYSTASREIWHVCMVGGTNLPPTIQASAKFRDFVELCLRRRVYGAIYRGQTFFEVFDLYGKTSLTGA